MTCVITDNCIRCKHTNCVELCPVDCFHEGENMLMIHPDECTDCGVFVPECPAEAIFADTDTVPNLAGWLALNSKYSARRLHIVTVRPPPDAAADWDGVADKFTDHFSPNSG